MNVEGRISRPPSKRQLALYLGTALVVASLVVICCVLPAEFHIDPTGFGTFSGLTRLSATKPVVTTLAAQGAGAANTFSGTRDYPAPYRSDRIDIRLAAAGAAQGGDELEYKVRMKAGDSFVYSWSAPDVENPEEFYYDFHGETPAPDANTKATVVEYRQATGKSANGVLVAPISGVHGWYLQNQSVKPVIVHVKLSGFYELIPPGEYGNQTGIKATRIAD